MKRFTSLVKPAADALSRSQRQWSSTINTNTSAQDQSSEDNKQKSTWEKLLDGSLQLNHTPISFPPNQWKEKEENRKLKPSDPSDLGYWS